MKAESPATGIMKKAEYDDAVWYEVACECGDPNHHHSIWIESDSETKLVTVDITTESKTRWWDTAVNTDVGFENETLYWTWSWAAHFANQVILRTKLVFQILFRGYVKYESSVILNKQQALNYADALKKAVKRIDQK